jgi:hypothetical protein
MSKQGTFKESLKKTIVMRTFNLNGIEVLSNRELACVKGGGEEGIPVPIIIVEEGTATVATLSLLSVSTATTTTTPTKKKK